MVEVRSMLQLYSGFAISRAIYIAAKLGLADLLAPGPLTDEDLARATETRTPALRRLLRALSAFGILAEHRAGRYALTPLGATLRSDTPDSVRAWVLLHQCEESYRAWGDLLHSVRTGEPGFEHVYGMKVWEYRARDPEGENAKVFDQAMSDLIGSYNAAVVGSYCFEGHRRIVDLGGGDGSLLIAILRSAPKAQGVLFDLPHVAKRAAKRIADAGLSDRCEARGGDLFADLPSGAGLYVLSRVLNSFADEQAVSLLRNCRNVMPHDGRLLVIERVLPDTVSPTPDVQAMIISDLTMLAVTGGQERNASEYGRLFAEAGMHLVRCIRTESIMTVLEATPEL